MRRFAVGLVVAGCGTEHHGVATDATVDYVFDAACRAESFEYHGRLVDNASLAVSSGASLVVRGDATRTATSASTGAFVLCAPTAPFMVDVDGTGDQLDGHIVALDYQQVSGLDLPPFTATRLTAVLAGLGQVYDASTGVVIAVQLGDSAMELSGSHGVAITNHSLTWATGAHGATVVFPNVAAGTPTLSRPVDGFEVATEVLAGQITWVVIPHVEL